ncbi:histidinol-phosphate transaminase [Candidatus Stoquefichus massiliensis]|uniref:histidinol-phosphate transaminase n=1 Tax=Candidatus Stoquefichus massiliensis TaxID=1470350 RepID=UPI000483AF61|nr:histidinol-phosphate transaminase [Candidatus Stoquefichus massiliensis]
MSWQDKLRNVEPYQAGEQPKIQNLIKLNTNENPYAPGEKVKQAILNFNADVLPLYPNPDADELKHSLALYHGLQDNQVFLGNGSDEVLALTFLTCFNGKAPVLFPDISYSFYPVYCELYGMNYQMIPLNEQFEIVKEDYYQENSGIIFPNPNAPTGLLVTTDFIEDILKHNSESIVVIDEAYIDFGGESAMKLLNQYPNLLITQTFSKFRSLAGIRLGVALGNQEIISKLYDVKNSFNSYPIDSLAQVIGKASIEDSVYIRENAQKIIETREYTKKELKALGFVMPDSYANFIFVSHPNYDAKELFGLLRERGILVRYFDKPRINQYLRITIGTQAQMETFIQVMKDIL